MELKNDYYFDTFGASLVFLFFSKHLSQLLWMRLFNIKENMFRLHTVFKDRIDRINFEAAIF